MHRLTSPVHTDHKSMPSYHLGSFCYSGCAKKTKGGDYNQQEIIIIIFHGAGNVIFSLPNKARHHLSFISSRPRGVLSPSVFITRRWPLNLQNCSLCIIWHVKTFCLGGGRDRCEEEMCSHTGPGPYLPAVFSGLWGGAASQQDDPSCWPHTPEPCLILTVVGGASSQCDKLDKVSTFYMFTD